MVVRFLMLVNSAAISGPPPKELIDAITKLSEEATKTGAMIESAGLACLESLPWLFWSEPARCELAQFGVRQGQELLTGAGVGVGVASSDGRKTAGDFVRRATIGRHQSAGVNVILLNSTGP
jgi:hypothetical protein